MTISLIQGLTCQSLLKKTRLGSNYTLDQKSFICAGGEHTKGKFKGICWVFLNKFFLFLSDVCSGDSGAPLMCEIGGQFYVTGLAPSGISKFLISFEGKSILNAWFYRLQCKERPSFICQRSNLRKENQKF